MTDHQHVIHSSFIAFAFKMVLENPETFDEFWQELKHSLAVQIRLFHSQIFTTNIPIVSIFWNQRSSLPPPVDLSVAQTTTWHEVRTFILTKQPHEAHVTQNCYCSPLTGNSSYPFHPAVGVAVTVIGRLQISQWRRRSKYGCSRVVANARARFLSRRKFCNSTGDGTKSLMCLGIMLKINETSVE